MRAYTVTIAVNVVVLKNSPANIDVLMGSAQDVARAAVVRLTEVGTIFGPARENSIAATLDTVSVKEVL